MTRWALRLCAAVAVVTWALPAAHAQTRPAFIPDVAEIRRLLESATPRDQALGAWLAAQAQARDLVPVLREVASAHRTAEAWQDSFATGAALDALIQLGTPPPATWARSFFDRWPAQSLILLSRAGDDATAELIGLASTQTGIRWLTAANLLLKRRSPGFAALLLRDLEISADLAIVSSEKQSFSSGGGGGDASAADGAGARAPEFPPLTHYYLSTGPHPGAVVLATGPQTIFFMREVSAPGDAPAHSWTDTTAPRPGQRFDYIAALLDTSVQSLSVKSRESRIVVGRDGLSVDKESAAFREDILKRYTSLVAVLVGKGLLTSEEAVSLPQPKVVITIQDHRGRKPL